jgi:hypothetical protein
MALFYSYGLNQLRVNGDISFLGGKCLENTSVAILGRITVNNEEQEQELYKHDSLFH